MTTNREKVLAAIRDSPGLTDRELCEHTGIAPHQQVNQICRSLEREGLVTRAPGTSGRIVNQPRNVGQGRPASALKVMRDDGDSPDDPSAKRWWTRRQSSAAVPLDGGPVPAGPVPVHTIELPPPVSVLVLFPCSGRKAPGGGRISGPTVLELLPHDLRKQLVAARRSLAGAAHLDEDCLLPAWQRNSGTLYRNASAAIGSAVQRSQAMLTLSGGYGLVLPAEPIGMYDRGFKLADWPVGLLQRCLVAIAEQTRKSEVIAFCARTTGYAELVRSTPWQRCGVTARLVSPVLSTSGGAQVLVPKVLGLVLASYLAEGVVPASVDHHSIAIEEVTGR